LFLTINAAHNINDSFIFEPSIDINATTKEIFDMKSINGIRVAGKTRILDNI